MKDTKFNNLGIIQCFALPVLFLFLLVYCLFYTFSLGFKDKDLLQISTIILVAKDRALKASKDDSIEKWNVNNCFSQILFVAQFFIKILENLPHILTLLLIFF